MLPNKFFEAIQSGIPVIASDYPAIASLIKQFGIGFTMSPYDEVLISEHIEKLRTSPMLYKRLKSNVYNAKGHLCWEKEKAFLINAYSKLNSWG